MTEAAQALPLNQQIATELGWRVVFELSTEYWRLFDPDGNRRGGFISESEAWLHAPDFEHNLNAVVDVLPKTYHLEITWEGSDYYAQIWHSDMHKEDAWADSAETRQAAAAKALLAYLQWVSHREDE